MYVVMPEMACSSPDPLLGADPRLYRQLAMDPSRDSGLRGLLLSWHVLGHFRTWCWVRLEPTPTVYLPCGIAATMVDIIVAMEETN